jgi:hypothetical protein
VHPKVISGILGHTGVELAMNTYDHTEVEDFRQPLEQLLRKCYENRSSGLIARCATH